MTDRKEFEKWYKLTEGEDSYLLEFDKELNIYLREYTHMQWLAWQARGELDAARIKELEADQERLLDDTQKLANALLAQEKQVAELTAKLDKAKEALLNILVSDCDFARIDAIANEALEVFVEETK